MRRRITRLALMTALLALLVFGAPLAVAVRIVFLNDERAELTRIAERAAAAVSADALRGADPVELPAAESDIDTGVYRADHRRVAGKGPASADAPVLAALGGALTDQAGGGRLLVAVPVRDNEQVIGAVRVSSPTDAVTMRTLTAWAAMAALGGLAAGAAAALARGLAGRLSRPLSEFAGAATALGDGDFTVRASPSGIREIDTAATALNTTAARLDDLLARERAFSTRASHQLRTPLTGLRLTLEAALAGDGDLRAAAEQAVESADRLEHTIEDLLTLARVPQARSGPLDVEALLEDLRRERTGALAAQGRPLRINHGDDLPPVVAAAAAVRQILAVLIDNATTHGAGVITVTARDAGEALALEVSDEGAGPATPASVFDSRPNGTTHGLGLPLARSFAEAAGGRLVLTRPGPNPIFTLFLPAGGPGEQRSF